MNHAIRGWIVNLVVISLLGVAMDLLLPSGSMKRYARFLMGIIILTVMLKPVFQAFNQLPNLERYTTRTFLAMDFADINYQAEWLEGQNQREIKNYFIESIESHMEQQIKQFKGYEHVTVDVEMGDDTHEASRLPDIQRVYVDIGAPASSYIKPVRIKVDTKDVNISHPDRSTKAQQEHSRDEQEIKAFLSSIYGVDQSRIEVRFESSSYKSSSDDQQRVQEGELP